MAWPAATYLFALAASAAVVMIDKPVTVEMIVPEAVRHSKIVLLQLEEVLVRRNAPAVWNVFWDMPEANAQSSVNGVHFVGYIALVANSANRDPKPAGFTMQLPPAALVALRRQRTVRFTFVPVRKLPEGGVTITTLRLE
jgi:hypothetical protein